MNLWIIADTHFGHDAMMLHCNRPKSFEVAIFANLIHCVGADDVLIHLGDVCIYNDEKWHRLLSDEIPGKKWLIRGNHDKKSMTWYMSHGWDFVADSLGINVFGKRILLTHKPSLDLDGYDVNVHGHLHNTLHHPEDVVNTRHVLFVLEHHYAPMKLRTLVKA